MTRAFNYLIDTDWVIDCLRGVSKTSERFSNLLPEGIGLSIVSLAELLDGVVGSVRRQDDERLLWIFLDDLEIITLDEETCLIFAEERVRLRAARNSDRRYGPADRRYCYPSRIDASYQQPPAFRQDSRTRYNFRLVS